MSDIRAGYVRTKAGVWLVQVPCADSPWGFYLADDAQSWDGGHGVVGGEWELVPDAQVPDEVKQRLGWVLSDARDSVWAHGD